jgi:GPH family glycoside/pentoside/hexuronide:cation symporter
MHIYRYDPGEPNPYNLPILASSALVGIAALIGRISNPIASIVVGYLSDKTRSRWGRRRPFMAMSLFPMLVGFILVFTPPLNYPSFWNAAYLALTLIIFFLFFVSYVTPYLSLIAEVAETTEQRVRLSTLLAISNLLGNACGLIVAPGLLEELGFLNMALTLGLISCFALIMPLFIQENLKLPQPKHLPFWTSIQKVKQNLVFRPYIISQVLVWITINIIYLCTNFLVIALLNRQIGFGTLVNGAVLGGAVIGFVPINLLIKHLGKKNALRLSLIWLSSNLLALGFWPLLVRDSLWLCLGLLVILGTGLSALFVLPNAILADIIDEDTKQTGVQRGAIYFGIQAMVIAISSGVASLLVGAILMLGKTATQPLGVQLVYPLAGLCSFLASWVLSFYPLEN